MDDFENISIRGRVAYLLCSLEKLLIHHNAEPDDWNWVLEKLWTYTELEWLDDWMFMASAMLPECILAGGPKKHDLITESECHELRKLYSKSTDDIKTMMQIIHYVGTEELFGNIPEHSPSTLAKMREAVGILEAEGVNPPDPRPFGRYRFSECDGWGKRFTGKGLSCFLGDD